VNALVFLETKKLALAEAASKGLDMPKPFAKDVFLTECPVVGNTFGLTVDPLTVAEGTRLKLLRDTRNRFDSNSIVIKDSKDNRLGFVPMDRNEILARLLEAGKDVYAVVSKCVTELDGRVELTVKIYMGA